MLIDLTDHFNPHHFWGAVALGIVFLLFGFVLSWLLRRALATFIMWVVLALLFCHAVPSLNKLTTSLLAGVSIVSVVIGFAAQSTLGNLVSGMGWRRVSWKSCRSATPYCAPLIIAGSSCPTAPSRTRS